MTFWAILFANIYFLWGYVSDGHSFVAAISGIVIGFMIGVEIMDRADKRNRT